MGGTLGTMQVSAEANARSGGLGWPRLPVTKVLGQSEGNVAPGVALVRFAGLVDAPELQSVILCEAHHIAGQLPVNLDGASWAVVVPLPFVQAANPHSVQTPADLDRTQWVILLYARRADVILDAHEH